MKMKPLAGRSLPLYWMMLVELALFITAVFLMLDGDYVAAILIGIYIEIRDISNGLKKQTNPTINQRDRT
jgi:uncharacterized protein YneF (UPF0154 family)